MGYLADCKTVALDCKLCKISTPPPPRKLRVFTLRELERATDYFSEKNLLGKGSHARVYKGVLNDGQVVAIKRPTTARRTMRDVTSVDNELEILSKLNFRHLVNLIGYSKESSEKLLVVEFMGNGTLFDLLHSRTEPLSWPVRVHMAFQAAQAILALHSASPPIIHRDVKSSNILVDGKWNAKLGDLGLALRGQLEDVVGRRTPPAGTMGYIDPGYETPSQLSSKSDVFSFGILLLEIISGRNAIDVRFNPSSIVDWAVPLIREGKSLALCDPALDPPQNTKVVFQLAAIAANSVKRSKDKRPTMADVVEGLRQVKSKLPAPRFGGKSVRNNIFPASVIKSEVSEEFSSGVSSCKSDAWPIFDVLGEESASPAASVNASYSRRSLRMRSRMVDRDLDGQVLSSTPLLSSAGVPTGKFENPLFDCNVSPAMINSSMTFEVIDTLRGSPPSSVSSSPRGSFGSVLSDRDTSSTSLENPTFGSKSFLRAMRPSTSGRAPGISTQRADYTVKAIEKTALEPYLSAQRIVNTRTAGEPTESNAHFALPGHSHQRNESSSQLLSNEGTKKVARQTVQSPAFKPVKDGMMTGAQKTSDKVAKVDLNSGFNIHPTVSFRVDFSPMWDMSTTSKEVYTRKVDLPIAV